MSLHFRADSTFEPVLNNGQSRMTLVSLDAGQVIDTHRALVPVSAIVLTGEINFQAEDEVFNLKPGEALLLEPREAHSLSAVEKSTILVTRLANPEKVTP
jgi:quercetin dioxygenase-like cupin family protein